MGIQLADAAVIINNDAVAIVPNSLVYTEGFGEQTVKSASIGGGEIELIFSNNIEGKLSKCNFSVYATITDIEKARQWKSGGNTNLVQITGKTTDGKILTRTFTLAALVNDYEVALGSDTEVPLEFMSNPAV